MKFYGTRRPVETIANLLPETENAINDDMLALLNTHGLPRAIVPLLLERLGQIIEMEQRLTKEITH